MANPPVPPFHYAEELSLHFRLPTALHDRTCRAIFNAWIRGSVIDSKGAIWVDREYLHTILRTKRKNSHQKYSQSMDRFKTTIGDKDYLLSVPISALLDQAVYEATTHRQAEYVIYSERLYRRIRDSELARNKRLIYSQYLAQARRNLKRDRLKHSKRKGTPLKRDELTGRPLSQRAEFSHIRSASLYYELTDKTWNGLIVNKRTHDRITRNNVCDEEDLRKLCRRMGWNTDWYPQYKEELSRRGL